MKSLSRRKYNYHYPIEQYHNYTWYCHYTHNTQNRTFPQSFVSTLFIIYFFQGRHWPIKVEKANLFPNILRKVQMRQKMDKSLPKGSKNWQEMGKNCRRNDKHWLGCLLDFEGLCRPWLFEEKIPRRRKYVNNKYSFLGSIPPLAAIGVWYRLVPTPTSFVFQRCLWLGKWSDLGSDSRLSGSLIGSPSANIWWSNQHIWNNYLGFVVVIISDSWADGWEDKLLAVTYILMILMVNFKDG